MVGTDATVRNVVDVCIDADTVSGADDDDMWPLVQAADTVTSTADLTFSGACDAYAFTLQVLGVGSDEALCLVLSNPHPGDANLDGAVDVGDLGIVAGSWGTSGNVWTTGDFTDDGLVNVGDLGIVAGAWGWANTQQGMGQQEQIDWDPNKNGVLDEEDAEIIFETLLN